MRHRQTVYGVPMRGIIGSIFILSPALAAFLSAFTGAFIGGCGASGLYLPLALGAILTAGWLADADFILSAVFLPCLCFCGYFLADAASHPPRPHCSWMLPRPVHGVTARLRICDRPPLSPALARCDSGRGRWEGELVWMAPNYLGQRHAVTGRVQLRSRTREIQAELTQCQLGDELQVTGTMQSRSASNADDGDMDWHGASLHSRNILHTLEISRIHARWPATGRTFPQWIAALRIRLAERLIDGIDNVDDARLLLALGMGMGEFPSRETRQRQAAAGTVHIFAISGMHVGMMALAIALALRLFLLPLWAQWLGAGGLCMAYVVLTGAAPSSQRALMMTLLVLYSHFRRRPVSWLNALGCAGLAALLMNPLVVLNLGFLFSYLAVLLLLMRAPAIQNTAMRIGERALWLPRELRPYRRLKLIIGLVCGLQTGLDAWLGTAGLGICLTRQLSLTAPIVNVLIAPLAYATLMLCPLRIVIGMMAPPLDNAIGTILGVFARLTRFASECGSYGALCLPVAMPSKTMVMLYHLLLAVWLLNAPARREDAHPR